MDLSIVYGSQVKQTESLRTKSGGRMITVVRNGQEWPPQEADPTKICAVSSKDEPCYLAGKYKYMLVLCVLFLSM